MSGKEVDWITDAAKAGTELHALIREAHEATRDFRTAKRELEECLAAVKTFIDTEVLHHLERTVDEELEKLGVHTKNAMEATSNKVQKEFESLTNIMMGKDDDGPDLDLVALAYKLLKLIKEDPRRVTLVDIASGKYLDIP